MSIENFYLKLLLYCYDSVSWVRFGGYPSAYDESVYFSSSFPSRNGNGFLRLTPVRTIDQ
jgi:hypothetical protein